MIDNYMLDRVLDKITMIVGIEKFDNTKVLVDTDDKQANKFTLKNVILIHVL